MVLVDLKISFYMVDHRVLYNKLKLYEVQQSFVSTKGTLMVQRLPL